MKFNFLSFVQNCNGIHTNSSDLETFFSNSFTSFWCSNKQKYDRAIKYKSNKVEKKRNFQAGKVFVIYNL